MKVNNLINAIRVKLNIRSVRRSLRPYRMFQPVVGCSENGELVYGRHTGYYEPEVELDEIWTISGECISCTDVKRISEKCLISWAQINA